MTASWQQIIETARALLAPVLHIVIPIAILVVGWLVALVAAGIIRRMLRRTQVDNRMAGWIFGEEAGTRVDIEKWVAKTIYYVLMIFVVIAFLQSVGLTIVTEPLQEMLVFAFAFAPRIMSAGVLLLVAWALGSALRFLVTRMLTVARVDERIGQSAGLQEPERLSIPQAVGNTVYWLVFLIFLPAVLGALGLEGLLAPVRDMLGEFTGFLPNLFAGALILVIGWFAARIVQRIVTNLLAAAGLDRAGDRAGLESVLGTGGLSELVGYRALRHHLDSDIHRGSGRAPIRGHLRAGEPDVGNRSQRGSGHLYRWCDCPDRVPGRPSGIRPGHRPADAHRL